MFDHSYDCIIIGGGLAGLSAAIRLRRYGHSVLLLEKETFPFHRVCGEYISLESRPYLESLGVPLEQWQVPVIRHLQLSAPNGRLLEHRLPLGGFGVSRYTLDQALCNLAREAGVDIREDCRVTEIEPIYRSAGSADVEGHRIHSTRGVFESLTAVAAYGKRSRLDVRWKRRFIQKKSGPLENYLGVKYHIRTDFPEDHIALHNFDDGYCGLSKVDGDAYCLCYLTTAANLRKAGGSIPEMEKTILSQNPRLAAVFRDSEFLWPQPLTISQISFAPKTRIEEHVWMVGDAAGMITPLCGNGMSMALHASVLAADSLHQFLTGIYTRGQAEEHYKMSWYREFGSRVRTGRWIQQFFGHSILTNLLLGSLKPFPGLIDRLIRSTHGNPF